MSNNIEHNPLSIQAGLRQLVSWDLDTEWAEFVQFYLRVGGDWAECNQADSREEGVLLQYSNDGGISWGLIAEMYFTDFTKPRWETVRERERFKWFFTYWHMMCCRYLNVGFPFTLLLLLQLCPLRASSGLQDAVHKVSLVAASPLRGGLRPMGDWWCHHSVRKGKTYHTHGQSYFTTGQFAVSLRPRSLESSCHHWHML